MAVDHFELIEHTADMGIEVRATSRCGLFEQAALGLRSMVFGPLELTPDQRRTIKLVGDDQAALLVQWLNELLYLLEVHRFCPLSFHFDHLDSHRLQVTMTGRDWQSAGLTVEREVKAVTYHQVEVRGKNGDWWGRVFVDL